MFSLSCLFVALVVSHFGFEGGTLVRIVSVPRQCLPFTFCQSMALGLSIDNSEACVTYVVKKAIYFVLNNKCE